MRDARWTATVAPLLIATSISLAPPRSASAQAAPASASAPQIPAATPAESAAAVTATGPEGAPVLPPVSVGFPTPSQGAPAPTGPKTPEAALPSAPPSLVEPSPSADGPQLARQADASAASVHFEPGRGLAIASPDGNFSLKVQLKMQLLDELQKSATSGAKARNGFIVQALRLALGGHMFSRYVKYYVELTFAGAELKREQPKLTPATAGMVDRDLISQSPLLDAYLDVTYLRDLNVRVGQRKVPYGREHLALRTDLLTVDRTLEDAEFNFDRDIGVDVHSDDFLGANALRYSIGVFAGEDRNATFTSLGTGELGLMYLGRVELLPLGIFDQIPGDASRVAPKLSVGAAYAFLQADASSPSARQTLGTTLGMLNAPAKIDYNVHNFTLDALFKVEGFTALTAFHYRKLADLPRAAPKGRNGFGWVLQAAYLLSANLPLEFVGSYGMIRPESKQKSDIVGNDELSFGLNYYFEHQALKLQGEYAHIWFEDHGGRPDNRLRIQLQAML